MSATYRMGERVRVNVGPTGEPRFLEGTIDAIEESRTRGHRYGVACGPRDYWIVGARKLSRPVTVETLSDRQVAA